MMLKKILGYTLAIALIVLSGILVRHYLLTPAIETGTISTQSFFAAEFPGLDGQPQPLKQWQGKTMVVNFWATWCPPCLEEMPELSSLHADFQDQNLIVLGISSDDLEKIREFSSQTPVSYPLLSGDIDAMNISESLGNDKGVLPYTVIISPDGRLVKSYFGLINQALLEQDLRDLQLIKK
jgi:peroxiredoxin